MQYFTKVDYQSLVKQVEEKTLAPEKFDHLAHLRLGASYFLQLGFKDGLEQTLSSIERYAKHVGAKDKYHATLSYSLYRILVEELETLSAKIIEPGEELDVVLQELRLNTGRDKVLEFYTEFTLDSDTAKRSVVLPDKSPFSSDGKYEPEPYRLHVGTAPVLVSMPHNGTLIPPHIASQMTAAGRSVADTDWYLRHLYDFIREQGCYFITPKFSRYVIDLNRPADGGELYPGANNTELCPTSTFSFEPIYEDSGQPTEDEIRTRIESIWRPYHQAIAITLEAMKKSFGQVVLLEAHSIASQVPRFFDGTLPDFNFGTNDGHSCNKFISKMIERFSTGDYSKVINGRFKGGFITRHFGRPDEQVSAIQLELSQRCYMDEKSLSYCDKRAESVKPVLQELIVQLKGCVKRNG